MKLFFEKANIDVKGSISDNMTEKEFFSFCHQNENLRIERDEEGQIFIMAPTSSETGNKNFKIAAEIALWNKAQQSGVAFDSSTGFTLTDNSILSPDVSWMRNEKWNVISKKDKEGFAHVCPDFVIELKSKSDNLNYLKNKMHKWIKNGCSLGWLINIESSVVLIFRKDGTVDKVSGFQNNISGEDVLPGFQLDLNILK